jgi:hypothetical protein
LIEYLYHQVHYVKNSNRRHQIHAHPKKKWSVPWFDCDEKLTCLGLNFNSGNFDGSTPIYLCGESCLLVSWCTSDDDRGSSRRPGVEDRGWSSTRQILGGRTIERSGDVVYNLHCTQGDEEHMFLGLASKQGCRFFSWFDLKTGGFGFFGLCLKTDSYGLVIWTSKSM